MKRKILILVSLIIIAIAALVFIFLGNSKMFTMLFIPIVVGAGAAVMYFGNSSKSKKQ